jgi:F-type H+-transporting ATPase subunit delta
MITKSSGKRYAQAVFELALEKNDVEVWQKDLEKMTVLTRDKKLIALLENPSLSFSAKKFLLQERLGKIHPLAFNLALLLVGKGRLRFLENISQKYNELFDTHRGIVRAGVTTVLPLDDREKDAISRQLGKMVERKVIPEGHVDPSIVGGFIARMGDTLIDGSIRQKLESLKRSLVEGNG